MWFSVYEVAKAHRVDAGRFTKFATDHMTRYGVELHAWSEIVVDAAEVGALLEAFRAQFPEHCSVPPDGEDDPACLWHPLDFFMVDQTGERIWSKGNPKWKEDTPVPRRRLP